MEGRDTVMSYIDRKLLGLQDIELQYIVIENVRASCKMYLTSLLFSIEFSFLKIKFVENLDWF